MAKAYRKTSTKKPERRTRLVFFILGGLLLLALGVFFATRRSPGTAANIEISGAPAIRIEKEAVDLGAVKLGQNVQVDFQVSNVGDKPLLFSEAPYIDVKEGC